ncbi:hypothetical protein BsWGS_03031 [Bradybaena similaris]
MAGSLYCCVVLLCCIVSALAVLNAPCSNQYTDCEAGECCATTAGAPEDFTGFCQKAKVLGDQCTPERPKDGECGCPRYAICVTAFGEAHASCQVILP